MRILKCAPLIIAFAAAAISPAFAAEEGSGDHNGWIERVCSDKTGDSQRSEWAQRIADRLADRLKLNDAQKTALKALQDARAQARADRKAALCASKPDVSTFEKRLEFRQTMAENRLAAMKTVTPKLIAFYNSLDDLQKQDFEEILQRMRHHGDHAWRDDGRRDWGDRPRHRHDRDNDDDED